MTTGVEPPPSRTVDVGGRRIAYRQAGNMALPVIVLLHGLGGNAAMWRWQYAGLSDRFRVIGWDMPGYGGSEPLPGAPGPAEYAGALAALLDAIGVAEAGLVGQSVAALIAASFARARPGGTTAVVLAHPLFGFGALEPAERAVAVAGRTGAFETLGPRGFARDRAPRLLSPGAPPALLAEVVDTMAAARPEGYLAAVAMMTDADLVSEAAGIAAPVHVIAGADDPLAPPERCRRLAAELPGARCTAIDRTAHYAALERPEAFNSALAEAFGQREQASSNQTG